MTSLVIPTDVASNCQFLNFSQHDKTYPEHFVIDLIITSKIQYFLTEKGRRVIEETLKILKMPRNTCNSEKQPNSSRSAKPSQKRSVANVNKEDETKQKAKKIGSTATKGRKRAADYKSDGVEKNVATSSAKKTTKKQMIDTSEETDSDLDGTGLNLASAVIEDDQVVEMMVEDADTSYAQAEESDEEDGKITFSGGHTTGDEEMDSSPEEPYTPEQEMSNQEKIQALDEEMQEKIQEFHQLLNRGGLKGAAKLLNKCFDVTQTSGKCVTPKCSLPEGDSKINKRCQVENSANSNCNTAILKEGLSPSNSTSEVTIYKNAIAKCNNTSSEEEDMEIDFEGHDESSPKFECAITCFADNVDPQPGTSDGRSTGPGMRQLAEMA